MNDSNNERVELRGGRNGLIHRRGKIVIRPRSPYSNNIHLFLEKLREIGFDKCPVPQGYNENGFEIVSLIEGEVSNYPLSTSFNSMETIESAGAFLKEFHNASELAFSKMPKDLKWLLPNREDPEVVCHGDFAPYNAVVKDRVVIGLIDFDTAHFGKRLDDVSYGMYRWATLFRENSPDIVGPIDIQIERAKYFCNGYELPNEERGDLIDLAIEKISDLVKFMRANARNGHQGFIENIRDGHDIGYLEDIEYLKRNRLKIENGIVAG